MPAKEIGAESDRVRRDGVTEAVASTHLTHTPDLAHSSNERCASLESAGRMFSASPGDGSIKDERSAVACPPSEQRHRVKEAPTMLACSPPFSAASSVTPRPLVCVMCVQRGFRMEAAS